MYKQIGWPEVLAQPGVECGPWNLVRRRPCRNAIQFAPRQWAMSRQWHVRSCVLRRTSWTKWSCPQYSLTGHHGVVRLLLEAGAEVGLVTRDTGYSSLHLAASGVASLALWSSPAPHSAGGHAASCSLLVEAGAPLDQVTETGMYSLQKQLQ